MSRRGVLVVARDAGAAAALAPVVAWLESKSELRPEIVAWGNARDVFEADGFAVRASAEDPRESEIADLLDVVEAAAVLTGTSLRVDLDSRFWSSAHAAGIPSVALLDHWKNYVERFTLRVQFDAVPTAVAVMDEVAERALVALGCPPDRIRVTGQPRFDELPERVASEARSHARAALGIDPLRPVAAFASEPRGRPYDDGTGPAQADSLEMFLDGVAAADVGALALVKPHPVERSMPAIARSAPETRVVVDASIRELADAADVFFGISSIALLDAALLGLPAVSIQPGGAQSDFVRDHSGLIATATTVAEVAAAFADGLHRGPMPVAERPSRDAAAQVGRLLHELVAAAGIMQA